MTVSTEFLDKLGRKYHQDDNGEIWYPYIFEYRHDGKTYGLTLWARTEAEAEIVRQSVCSTLKLSGEFIQEMPA